MGASDVLRESEVTDGVFTETWLPQGQQIIFLAAHRHLLRSSITPPLRMPRAVRYAGPAPGA